MSARLEGNTYSMSSSFGSTHLPSFAVDGPELIGPQIESGALFVPTTVATTRGQKQDNCTDPAQPCNADADCMRLPPLAYGLCDEDHGRCSYYTYLLLPTILTWYFRLYSPTTS